MSVTAVRTERWCSAVADVYVTGVGMTPFGNHGPGMGVSLAVDAALAALRDAGTTFAEMDILYAGAAHPLSPRGVFVARELGLTGIPVQHVSNASATGLAAAHEAVTAIEAGRAEVALVVGFDSPETEMPTEAVITGEGHHPPVVSFALWARQRMAEFGTTPEHLAAVATKNWNYARSNPFAARRAAEPVTVERVLGSRVVADPFTSMMCTPWAKERQRRCSARRAHCPGSTRDGPFGLPPAHSNPTGSDPGRCSKGQSWAHPSSPATRPPRP